MQTVSQTFLVELKRCEGQWRDTLILQKWYELASSIELQQRGSTPSQNCINRLLDMFDETISAVTYLYDNHADQQCATKLFNKICEFYRWLGSQTGLDEQNRIRLWRQWQPSAQNDKSITSN